MPASRIACRLDALRRILAALGLPCDTAGDCRAQRRMLLEAERPPPLVTATVGQPIDLADAAHAPRSRATAFERTAAAAILTVRPHRRAAYSCRASTSAGYHSLEIGDGAAHARGGAGALRRPSRTLRRASALGALPRKFTACAAPGDCGIGDMARRQSLWPKRRRDSRRMRWRSARSHALFAADPNHFSPYSPSSRLFYNPLLCRRALAVRRGARRQGRAMPRHRTRRTRAGTRALIDWPRCQRAPRWRSSASCSTISQRPILPPSRRPRWRQDFAKFRAARRSACWKSTRCSRRCTQCNCTADPAALELERIGRAQWRDPRAPRSRAFAAEHQQRNSVPLLSAMDRRPLARRGAAHARDGRHADRSDRRSCRRHEQRRQPRLDQPAGYSGRPRDWRAAGSVQCRTARIGV